MRIVIAGFGIEGRTNYDYFRMKLPEAEVIIADEGSEIDGGAPEGAKLRLGPGAFSELDGFDMVVRTAGLAPWRIATDGRLWSATNEFFSECKAPIIGVTGTKGKGTTSSLISSILSAAGKTVHLVGNIGVPALSILPEISPDDVVIYELSSFQLWDLERSPKIAVVLMIEPDHLDVHKDFEEYVAAKSRIIKTQAQDDVVVHHPSNEHTLNIAAKSQGKTVRYGVIDDGGVYVESNNFCIQGHAICSVGTLHLVGQHNIENACAAITAVRAYDPSVTDEAIAKGLSSFEGLDHRLKLVAVVDEVRYYDDSIATTPGSAIAAIKSFSDPKVIILGGSDKGADYHEVVQLCQATNTKIVAIGQTGKAINKLAEEIGAESHYAESMLAAVEQASKFAEPGGVVILSPAAASFDMFKNYQDRGNQFIEAVAEISRGT